MRSIRNEKAVKAREKKNHDAGRDFRDEPAWLIAELNRRLDRLSGDDEPPGAARDGGGAGQGKGRDEG
jgi:hypothetical protein